MLPLHHSKIKTVSGYLNLGDVMGTILLQLNKSYSNFTEVILNFSVIAVLVLSSNLLSPAADIKIAQSPISPAQFNKIEFEKNIIDEIEPVIRAKNFNDTVSKKYPNAAIFNVTDGVKHIKLTKYYDGKPVRVNVVEADLKLAKDLKLTPALSSSTLHSRRTITTIAKNTNAVVALNGTFFKPQTGVPLGTLMINGKMYTGPIYDRVALGIFPDDSVNKFDIARVQLNSYLKSDKEIIKVDNINQPRMLSSYVLIYTSDWGKTAPPTPKYGIQIAVENDKAVNITTGQLDIPENGYVIVGPEKELNRINMNKKLELSVTTTPEWKNVEHIISGGPYLVKEGEVFVDIIEQKLGAIGGRNPRSAIGYTADENLIMVAVDGREGSSVGMTLTELAWFMKSIGCVSAMNLDGGGSTVMYVNDKIVNNPQQQGGVPVSNAIILAK